MWAQGNQMYIAFNNYKRGKRSWLILMLTIRLQSSLPHVQSRLGFSKTTRLTLLAVVLAQLIIRPTIPQQPFW
jgi:hypothetical protein